MEVKEYQKFIKEKARESAELKAKVSNEYIRLYKELPEPKNDNELRASLCDRFSITPKRLQNILDNKHTYLNAKEQSFTSGLVMGHYVTLIRAANEAIQGFDEYLEFIEREKDSDFIDIEQYAGAKGEGTKAVTPRELRGRVLRDKFDIVKDSFEPLKALAPKIIQVQDSAPRFDSLEDLQKQKKIIKEQLKLNEGIEDEEE